MPENVARTFLEHLFHPDWPLPPLWNDTEAVAAMVEGYINSGGVTFSLYFGNQTSEPLYVVGLDNNLTRYPVILRFDSGGGESRAEASASLADAMEGYLQEHRRLLTNPRCCIGLWSVTQEDGSPKLFLDVSVLVYNETQALAFGREGNQIAIFSLREGRELEIGGTGESSEARLLRLAREDRPAKQEGSES